MPNKPGWSDSKKWVMGIVSALIMTVAGTFLFTPLSGLFFPPEGETQVSTVTVTASLKSFDMVADTVGSPQMLEIAAVPLDNIDDVVSKDVWPQMRAIIVPTDLPDRKSLELEIKDAKLHADEPLVAYFEWRYQTVVQMPIPQRELREGIPVDLAEAFSLTENPRGSSETNLRIQLADKSGRYHRAHIVVAGAPFVTSAPSYSFQPNSDASFSTELRRKPIRILIADIVSTGLESDLTEAALLQFQNTVTETVNDDSAIQLVGFTLKELRAKRDELKALEWSAGKVDVIEGFSVDYFIEPTLLFQ